LISYFLDHQELHQSLRERLYDVRDIERILAKVTTGKVNGSDLLNLSFAIKTYFSLLEELVKLPNDLLPKLAKQTKISLLSLAEEIVLTINDEIGANLEKGNLIKTGCHKNRD